MKYGSGSIELRLWSEFEQEFFSSKNNQTWNIDNFFGNPAKRWIMTSSSEILIQLYPHLQWDSITAK